MEVNNQFARLLVAGAQTQTMELIQTLRATASGDDDRGVSPVIGVILMVAITVILAAVIATFVLGLGEQVSQTAPQANFDFDVEGDGSGVDTLTVSHTGGQTIDRENIKINVGGSVAYEDGSEKGNFSSTNSNFDTEIGAGDQVELVEDTNSDETGSTEIDVLYVPDNGNTATLSSQTLEFNSN